MPAIPGDHDHGEADSGGRGGVPAAPAGTDSFTRRRVLEHRLDDGYRRIEEARLSGLDVRAWEEFWVHLLREYERVCDDLGGIAA